MRSPLLDIFHLETRNLTEKVYRLVRAGLRGDYNATRSPGRSRYADLRKKVITDVTMPEKPSHPSRNKY